MQIAPGDLKPDLVVALSPYDRSDTLVIENADSVHVVAKRGSVQLFDNEALSAVTKGRYAIITMEFESGDTDLVGTYKVYVVITWPGGKTQTVCSDNDLVIGEC